MSNTNDGGPAFPLPYDFEKDYPKADGGMSLRDYFAGQALAVTTANHQGDLAMAAHMAYVLADMMLRARSTDE
jgi:hypothetical protein